MRIAYRFTFLQFHEDESEDEDDAAQGRAHSAPPRLGFTAEITPAIGPGSAGSRESRVSICTRARSKGGRRIRCVV